MSLQLLILSYYGNVQRRGAWWIVETVDGDFLDEPAHGADPSSQKFSTSYALLDMDMIVAAGKVRSMMMVHNGELFDYHADNAEDVQRFAAIQWKSKF